MIHQRNFDDILRYVSISLVADWNDRSDTVMQIARKAGGCFLWAQIVVSILNAAVGEGRIAGNNRGDRGGTCPTTSTGSTTGSSAASGPTNGLTP